jgi:hypothetical protein
MLFLSEITYQWAAEVVSGIAGPPSDNFSTEGAKLRMLSVDGSFAQAKYCHLGAALQLLARFTVEVRSHDFRQQRSEHSPRF